MEGASSGDALAQRRERWESGAGSGRRDRDHGCHSVVLVLLW